MRVFVAGATGFIGMVVVQDLIQAGHQVLGLSRSEAGAKALAVIGAQTHSGHLEDLESPHTGAALADGVIHLAFGHDFSKFKEMSENDRRAIETLGVGIGRLGPPTRGHLRHLVGQPRPHGNRGRPDSKDHPAPRVSEQTALALVSRKVRASAVRLPQVHDRNKAGLVSFLIAVAREIGVSAYVGEGRNRWSAVHRLDVPPLYRLALEKRQPALPITPLPRKGCRLSRLPRLSGGG